MHKRFYGQRQHIIYSLDSLIYQLHTLSFFLSPSIWIYFCRLVSQFQYSKPRELDPNGSLRFFYGMVLLFNLPAVWAHLASGAVEGRVVILDFVGMSYIPSRIQLFSLDVFIVALQMLLTTVAYETSVFYASPDAEPEDALLPHTPPHFAIPLFQQPLEESSEMSTPVPPVPKQTLIPDIPLVIDLQIKPILAHIRTPPPPSQVTPSMALPADNGAWPLPVPGMRILMRARRQLRGTTTAETTAPEAELPTTRDRRIPGALDTEPPTLP